MVRQHLQATGLHQAPLLLRRKGRPGGHRPAPEHGSGPLDELINEASLPWCPCRRPGGLTVGRAERPQQLQGRFITDGLSDGGRGSRVFEVPPRRHVGQQEVVADQLLEHPPVVAGQAQTFGDASRNVRAGF